MQLRFYVYDVCEYAVLLFINSVSCCRHAVQLLTPANIVARTNGRDEIVKVNDYQDLYTDVSFLISLFFLFS